MLTSNSFTAIRYFLPFIKPMNDTLHDLYLYFETFNSSYTMISSDNKPSSLTLQDLDNEIYIDEHLKKQIITLKQCRNLRFTSGPITFTLDIYYQNENLDLFIQLVMYSLSFVSLLGPHTKKSVSYTFYLLDVKRVLDEDNLLDKEEVNGGCCKVYGDSCDISVWRKGEIIKVSIHELIHGLEYDYHSDIPEMISHYQSRYKITSKKMNTFEAYTEIFSEIIHCYLLSKWYSMINQSVDRYELFMCNVCIEREFSRFQTNKILHLNNSFVDMNKYTNVCAYYLIKTELYNDIQNFLDFCFHTNDSVIKITNEARYFDYLKSVKQVLKKKKNKVNNYLDKITNMTCLELNLFTP